MYRQPLGHGGYKRFSNTLESERSTRSAFLRAHQKYGSPSPLPRLLRPTPPAASPQSSWVYRLVFCVVVLGVLILLGYYGYTRYTCQPFHPLHDLKAQWDAFRSSACPRPPPSYSSSGSSAFSSSSPSSRPREQEWKAYHVDDSKRISEPPSSYDELQFSKTVPMITEPSPPPPPPPPLPSSIPALTPASSIPVPESVKKTGWLGSWTW